MFLELAIGDAYGAGFEYAGRDFIRLHNRLTRYVQHPRHSGVKPGCYTDDTQMSVAVAECLIEGFSREQAADWFVRAFRRDPREGYAGRFYDFLRQVQDGREFLRRMRPDSAKSGAAMRSLPVGWLRSLDEVRRVSDAQASLTHNTEEGRLSALLMAFTSHFLRYRLGSRRELPAFLLRHTEWRFVAWTREVGPSGMQSAAAALGHLLRCSSQAEILRRCVEQGGDVDTVACLALGAASLCDEVRADLPAHLVHSLENGAFGADYLTDLEQRLARSVSA